MHGGVANAKKSDENIARIPMTKLHLVLRTENFDPFYYGFKIWSSFGEMKKQCV
jgi:hypothetical protein